jgi:hypothetical protein
MIFPPTELALVNFNGFVMTANPNGAALQERKHGLPTEHAPVSDSIGTYSILVLNSMGRFAAHDVVSNQQNFEESESAALEPRAAPDGRRVTALDTSHSPITSPSETVTKKGTCRPRHITFTGATTHRFPKQADIFKEFNGHGMVIE